MFIWYISGVYLVYFLIWCSSNLHLMFILCSSDVHFYVFKIFFWCLPDAHLTFIYLLSCVHLLFIGCLSYIHLMWLYLYLTHTFNKLSRKSAVVARLVYFSEFFLQICSTYNRKNTDIQQTLFSMEKSYCFSDFGFLHQWTFDISFSFA